MLYLHGTREDTKIISANATKCSRTGVSVAEGKWVGQKVNCEPDLSGRELITEQLQVRWGRKTMLNTQVYYEGL